MSSGAELWVTLTEQKLLESRHHYLIEGGEACRQDELPALNPFAEKDLRGERLAREFFARWEGPNEATLIVPQAGVIARDFAVELKTVGVASSAGLAVARSGRLGVRGLGPLLVLPGGVTQLPLVEDFKYLVPAEWHPHGATLAITASQYGHASCQVLLMKVANDEAVITQRIALSELWYVADLAWSPDGARLAILRKRYREDTGLSKWISDVIYGGSHGVSIADFVVEIHSLDGSEPRVIPIEEGVEEFSDVRIAWRVVGPEN